MKTMVHLDDLLLKQADQAPRDLGLSRSELIAEALRCFLRQHPQNQVTAQLNRAHIAEPTPAERMLIGKLKTKLPVTDAW